MKFIVLKGKHIFYALLFACALLILIFFPKTNFTTSRSDVFCLVIDAGHGGVDGGAIGEKGISESQLNLDYALELKRLCESVGIKVVLTRSDMNGLYSPLASNKKRSEMEQREKIINSSNADAVVSIHMNSFSLSSSKGAQVFYKKGNEGGKALAENVQEKLVKNIENSRKTALVGDYYVLNCCKMPAVLVECGYLSNPEEEQLLCDKAYKENFCKVLLQGVINFFNI